MTDTKYDIVLVKNEKNQLIQRLRYLNGILEGESEFLSPTSGQITQIMNFSSGKLDGKTKVYDNDGHLISILNYKEGCLHGECSFFSDTILMMKSEYENNLRHGKTFIYNQNGSVSSIIEYQYGKKNGKTSLYQNNKLFKIENYKNNKLHGESIFFSIDDQSKILEISNYNEGLLDGYSKKYYDNGNIKEIVKFSHGNKISCKSFSVDGVETD